MSACPLCDKQMGFKYRYQFMTQRYVMRNPNYDGPLTGDQALEVKEGQCCSEACFLAACSVMEFIRDVGRCMARRDFNLMCTLARDSWSWETSTDLPAPREPWKWREQ